MSQTINFDNVATATFNGTTLKKIYVDSSWVWTAHEEKQYTYTSPNMNLDTTSTSTLSTQFDGLTQPSDNNYKVYLNTTKVSGDLGSNTYIRVKVYASGSLKKEVTRSIAEGASWWNFSSSTPPDSVTVTTYSYGGKKSAGTTRGDIRIRNYQ